MLCVVYTFTDEEDTVVDVTGDVTVDETVEWFWVDVMVEKNDVFCVAVDEDVDGCFVVTVDFDELIRFVETVENLVGRSEVVDDDAVDTDEDTDRPLPELVGLCE